jgi:hypothetical protein
MDAEGFFYVLDRKKDMIIRAGLKVFPAKVEAVLRKHPRIADAAVVGRADAVKTESVVAVVVARPAPAPADASAPVPTKEQEQERLADELRLHCREHLAPYEVPQHFEFTDVLPRSPLGKLLKRELRKAPAPPASAPASEAPRVEPAAPSGNGKQAATASAAAVAPGNGRHFNNGNGTGNGNGQGPNGHPGGKKPETKKETV